MSLKEQKEPSSEIEKLTVVLSKIQNVYSMKKEQLESLQIEISELKEILNSLNTIISTKSFKSADEIYSKLVESSDKQGTKIKRKIFSEDETQLLCILNFFDFNKIEVKFLEPEKTAIKESSENFLTIFLKGALIKIKERNPEMLVNYEFYKNTELIEYIHISNVSSIDDFDMVDSKIRDLIKVK